MIHMSKKYRHYYFSINMDKVETFLKNMGLSEKEATIYLAGLKAGPILASQVSRKTGFTRQHTYDLLKVLEQKGFLSKLGKNYGQRFVMEDPKNLKNVIGRQKSKLEKLEEKLNTLLPEMESFYSSKGIVPKIKFFEEIEGIKELYEDMLNCRSKEHYYLGSLKEMSAVVGEEYFSNMVARRIEKKIHSKSIRTKAHESGNEFYEEEKTHNREVRYTPEDVKYLQTMVLYDEKVAVISSQRENFGFVVESEEFYATMKILFDSLWDKSK